MCVIIGPQEVRPHAHAMMHHMSHSETSICRNLNLPLVTLHGNHTLLNIALLKIDMPKIAVTLKNRKTPNMSKTTRRPLPNIVCLKIDTAKNRILSHVNENILIGFDFQ
jgi:hypothetical protein